jgi:hypothetical protein
LEECCASIFRVELSRNSLLGLLTLHTDALYSSDVFVSIHQSTWCNILKDFHVQNTKYLEQYTYVLIIPGFIW